MSEEREALADRAGDAVLELGRDPDEERRVALESERDVKLDALDRVEQNASQEWIERARATVEQLARDHPTFIADDVWLAGLPKPSEARALGSIMKWAAEAGLIVGTADFIPSSQRGSHCVPRRVWRSLVYQAEP